VVTLLQTLHVVTHLPFAQPLVLAIIQLTHYFSVHFFLISCFLQENHIFAFGSRKDGRLGIMCLYNFVYINKTINSA
jgi:hypothetical protein